MRYDVKKYLFVGLEKERSLFFERAQELGIVHFIDPSKRHPEGTAPEVQDIAKGIKVVLGLPVTPQVEPNDDTSGLTLAREAISLKEKIDSLIEEERILRLEMSRVEVFGAFSTKDIALIREQGNRVIQFFCAKQGYSDNPDLPDELIYVGTENGLDYFAAVNKESTQYPKMVEMIIDRPWNELDALHKKTIKETEQLEHRLKGYSKYNRFLHKALSEAMNDASLKEANGFAVQPIANQGMFVVEGWVPEHKVEELEKIAKEMNVFIEQIEIEPADAVPTYLENEGASKIGEDLIHIYDTPSTTDKDPSLWVLVFFALFFSMIIGDGGYGLVLLLVALYIRYKHSSLHSWKKRALDLATILAFCTVVWGVLTTSFFGISVAPDNPLRKVSPLNWAVKKKAEYHIAKQDDVYQYWVKKFPDVAKVTDPQDFLLQASSDNGKGGRSYDAYNKFADNIMMELALLVGVVHVILSMGRHISRNWSYLGWIILIIGGYLYAPVFLDASTIPNFIFGFDREVAGRNGLYMVYAGMAIAVLIALFKHKLMGILEATVVISIFGDILSYMRLYALGLSGSLLTATTIDLASGAPLIFAIFILLIGHTVNLALGVMGGVIHGLRLNFLEWYHYSFEGGGKPFRPLSKAEIE